MRQQCGRLIDTRLQCALALGDRLRHRVEPGLERTQFSTPRLCWNARFQIARGHAADRAHQGFHRVGDRARQAQRHEHRTEQRQRSHRAHDQEQPPLGGVTDTGIQIHLHPAETLRGRGSARRRVILDLRCKAQHCGGKAQMPLVHLDHDLVAVRRASCFRQCCQPATGNAEQGPLGVIERDSRHIGLFQRPRHQALQHHRIARDQHILRRRTKEADDRAPTCQGRLIKIAAALVEEQATQHEREQHAGHEQHQNHPASE